MIENRFVHGWVRRIASGPGRSDNAGHTDAEQRLAIHQIGIDAVGRDGPRRNNGVEESAPFIEIHDEYGIRPVGAARNRLEGLGQKSGPVAEIEMRMIVLIQIGERSEGWIDE